MLTFLTFLARATLAPTAAIVTSTDEPSVQGPQRKNSIQPDQKAAGKSYSHLRFYDLSQYFTAITYLRPMAVTRLICVGSRHTWAWIRFRFNYFILFSLRQVAKRIPEKEPRQAKTSSKSDPKSKDPSKRNKQKVVSEGEADDHSSGSLWKKHVYNIWSHREGMSLL